MVSTPVRVAMIGLDHWYTAIPLAQAFAAHPEVELVGLADDDSARAREVAATAGLAGPAGSAKELLEDPAVDLVAIFTSTDKSPELCVAAAGNGKHILSIKPLANDLATATTIRTAVREAGVRFVPAESRGRCAPLARQLRQWIDEGRLGRILTANFQLLSGLPRAWPGATDPGWWVDPERAPGGGWIDHSIYHLDLLRWLTGSSITSVTGIKGNLKHTDLPFEDYGHATVELANGVIATDEVTWTAPQDGGRQSMTIVGTDGAVSTDTLTGRLAVTDDRYGRWVQMATLPGYPGDIDDVVAAARGDSEPLATVDDAWENLAACEAFYRSCDAGTPVAPAALP
jgi:predicted dehydrogenase